MEFEVTRQSYYFRDIQDHQKFQILDDLLFDCVGLGCGNWLRPDRVQGFNSGKAFGYALLTYFASMAIDFRRLPFCEDRIYTGYFGRTEQYKDVLAQLTPSRVDSIVKEARQLYEHTQIALKRAGLDNVSVRREIKRSGAYDYPYSGRGAERGYAETLVMLRRSCDVLGIQEVQIEMDTLNSFGDEGAYVSEVKIELTVPATDVFYCSALVGDRHGQQKTMESGEWVLINRSPTGLVTLPVSSIVYRPDMWKFNKPIAEDEARRFIANHEPIVFRPLYKIERPYGTYGVRPSVKQLLARQAVKIFGE